jgi:hypothetical protein
MCCQSGFFSSECAANHVFPQNVLPIMSSHRICCQLYIFSRMCCQSCFS